jgi:hypothetical protein
MGVLSLQKWNARMPDGEVPGGTLAGKQFPLLDMYAPFVHDGATFAGYQPLLSAGRREAGVGSLGSLLVVVALSLLCQ